MITITIYGIDPYLLKDISKEMTAKLASIYECDNSDINFFAPEGLACHEGIEQNTWNIRVTVNAPLKVHVLQDKAVTVIHNYIKDACVNMAIEFYYYHQDDRYTFVRDDYPMFMTESNSLYVDDEDIELDEKEDSEDKEEPYLGNAFEEFNKRNK